MRLGTQRVKSLRTLESSIGFVRARVAQLAEQGTLNPKVQGSTPCASTICVVQVRLTGPKRPSADVSHTFG